MRGLRCTAPQNAYFALAEAAEGRRAPAQEMGQRSAQERLGELQQQLARLSSRAVRPRALHGPSLPAAQCC